MNLFSETGNCFLVQNEVSPLRQKADVRRDKPDESYGDLPLGGPAALEGLLGKL